ncbi:MAG TPA: efflux RND transporter periplasmic adaptor subunit, partial [Candidatus Paceibacterota bacterium]|nr:efflux RND transporter periplasmic adaptor subunit [Candidatus Paceibacterota bacterium]
MKKWIVLLLLLAGGCFGFVQVRAWQAKRLQASLDNGPKTSLVEARDINFAINAAGDIGPADQVSVRPEINGRIETLHVDIGDKVLKGAVLFTLDDKDLQTERASRIAEIDGARLQLERAERNHERARQLFEQKLISQELYEDTKTNYELAKNSLDRATKQLAQVEERLTKTKIEAPFDCTILTRPVSVGQAVSGSGGFNSGTEVLTIANLNEMIINAHINQADVTRLKVGQEVHIIVEAIAGLELKGLIERLAPQATLKNGIKGYAARIVLKDLDERVRPGMTANLSIPIISANNVLAVPLSAVFTEQSERFVYVKNGQSFEKKPVIIGVSDFFHVEIQEGLEAGMTVALEPPPGVMETLPKEEPAAGPGGGS